MATSQIERWIWRFALAAILLHPLAYLGRFAGDAEIHLVYARAAADGRFFEFNPGEKTPGVTSPGYMLIVAALFRLFPETMVPAAMKGLDVLFWYGSVGLVALLMRQLTPDWRLVGLATLAAGLLPGSTYNATIGMENGLFGFVVLLAVVLAVRFRWFAPASVTLLGELTIGLVLGVGCWLRPEGFVIAALFVLVRGWERAFERASGPKVLVRSAMSTIPLALLAGAVLLFHHAETGFWLPGSGLARMRMGQLEAWRLGPIFVSPKPVVLLAAYSPLTFFWLLGCWWIARDRLASTQRRVLILSAGMSLLFFSLYSTVLGAAHLARYLIFVMPFVVVIAALAAGRLWVLWATLGRGRRAAFRAPIFALLGLGLAIVWGVEVVKRRELGSATELHDAMHAPNDRAGFSDRMESLLQHPVKRPIVLALQEVQMRYWLDERFVVRSLDGRTDPFLLQYADQGGIDHPGYFRDRGVDYLLELPNYNRDRGRWSLARLETLRVGETASAGGLSFLRLAGDPAISRSVFEVKRVD